MALLSFSSWLKINNTLLESSSVKRPKRILSTDADEHALEVVWNHTTGTNRNAVEEVERAKRDRSHPLHFDNAKLNMFKGRRRRNTERHKNAYYAELEYAAKNVESLKQHPIFKKSHKRGEVANTRGKFKGVISSSWTNLGTTDRSSKEDVRIGTHRISLKKGQASQLMSAQNTGIKGIYHHATEQAVKQGNMSKREAEEVRNKIQKVTKHLESMRGNTPEEQERHKAAAQRHIDEIHSQHRTLIHHIAHEAATGHGKFGGKDNEGTARFLITTSNDGVHVHDTETNHEPIEVGTPRVSLPKDKRRPGVLRLDYTPKKQ
jgi:hypothetical protein